MRRPHVYERSAPRPGRHGFDEANDPAAAARRVAAQLAAVIERAEQAGLSEIVELLEQARLKAEQAAEE